MVIPRFVYWGQVRRGRPHGEGRLFSCSEIGTGSVGIGGNILPSSNAAAGEAMECRRLAQLDGDLPLVLVMRGAFEDGLPTGIGMPPKVRSRIASELSRWG